MKDPTAIREMITRDRRMSFEHELAKRTPNRFVNTDKSKKAPANGGSHERR